MAEEHVFQTEVKQMLNLLANSLYSNKEVFLRELISNASDAADKLRFKALTNNDLYEGDPNLRIRISVDKDAKTLTISDNGIGMSEKDAIDHLGTIAKSGTAEFIKQLSGDQAKNSGLIGQFGVGFYSAFIVADKVTVESRAAGDPKTEGVRWVSDGTGTFSTEKIEKEEHGTSVILHIKDDEKQFLDDWQIRSIIEKYSDHIGIPVEVWQVKTPEPPKDGEEPKKPDPKVGEWKQINAATALWTREPKEIKDEEYKEFYKHISRDWEDPLVWAHNKVEGTLEYTSLLYIPSHAPFDLMSRDQKHGLKLYVQRVFIMDDAEDFMPVYLRFVKGVLDSADLPLNVSREILQNNRLTSQLRKACTKRVLNMLEKLSKDDPEKYQKFWTEFGRVMKEGPVEDYENRENVAKLLRFASTYTNSSAQTVSLDDYISRMKDKQKNIYYIIADSYESAVNSSHLELLKKKGVEVLLLTDRIDEWLMSNLTEYSGKKFVNAAGDDLELGDLADAEDKKKLEESQKANKGLVDRFKAALGTQVSDVKVTDRLVGTPSCVVPDQPGQSAHMVNLMRAMGQQIPDVKYILEINPDHPLVKKVAEEADEAKFKEWADLLYQQALLGESGGLKDPAGFVKRMNRLILETAGVELPPEETPAEPVKDTPKAEAKPAEPEDVKAEDVRPA